MKSKLYFLSLLLLISCACTDKNINEEIVVPCEYDELVDSKQGDKFLYGAISHNKLSLFDYDGYLHVPEAEWFLGEPDYVGVPELPQIQVYNTKNRILSRTNDK